MKFEYLETNSKEYQTLLIDLLGERDPIRIAYPSLNIDFCF